MFLKTALILASVSLTPLAHADRITGVAFTGTPANPTITIFGTGFGEPPTPITLAFPGFTGFDYGDALFFRDTSRDTAFEAGRGENNPIRDYIGLVLKTYTDHKIVYSFGSAYADFYYPLGLYQLKPGDPFFLHTDADYTGIVQYNVAATPEPATWTLLLAGLAAMLSVISKRPAIPKQF